MKSNAKDSKQAAHAHVVEFTGEVYEVCECGAVRTKARNGKPASAWHACALCSTAVKKAEAAR
jgi:hypothetical protein